MKKKEQQKKTNKNYWRQRLGDLPVLRCLRLYGPWGGWWHFINTEEFTTKECTEEPPRKNRNAVRIGFKASSLLCLRHGDLRWSRWEGALKLGRGTPPRSAFIPVYPKRAWSTTKQLSSLSQWAVGAHISHRLEARRSTKSWFPTTS